MKRIAAASLAATLVAALTSHIEANGGWAFWNDRPTPRHARRVDASFARVGTFANYRNTTTHTDATVSEIIAATADGRTLVYTDSPGAAIGFIDIDDPSHPVAAGTVALGADPTTGMPYQPTSVDVLGNRYALVAANSSESFTKRSGALLVVDIAARAIVADIPLGGQPDSVRVSPDQRYLAVAIENERNEALCVGGSADGVEADEDECDAGGGALGVLPQTPYGNPPGYLAVVSLAGPPASWVVTTVDLTGYSTYAPGDPEPEFVDINDRNEAVVTLQENNHIVVVDLKAAKVIQSFDAGVATVHGVDAEDDGIIALTDSVVDVPREPDAVTWVPGAGRTLAIATANEGDLFGGSRGFSIFHRSGKVAFDSGASLERIAVRHGHYPESRSDNKGTEPESIAFGAFARGDYLFVGSERGSFVAVYSMSRSGKPAFEQLLPAPLGPEGLLAIPQRNLLIASGEEDSPEFGVRSTVMIYELRRGERDYPQIVSDDRHGAPIPWSALSGMTAVPGRPNTLLAVWDSYYSNSNVFRIDVSGQPAVIADVLTITGGSRNGTYDPEGIAVAPDDTIWLASEGNASDSAPNLLIQTDTHGSVIREVGLPQQILECRSASTRRGTLGSGFEGVAILRDGTFGHRYRLVVAQQRGWDYTTPECEALDDDEGGLDDLGQPNWTRLWIYDPVTGAWDHVAWELAPKPANAAWAGLSEITEVANGDYIVIERDNLTGDFSELKTLVKVDRHALADRLVSSSEKAVFDLLPSLRATNGWITDKPEGVAVTADGRIYVVTDNDGVEDWSGETWFLSLGRYWRLF
jgi:hypothetical protein